MSDKKKQSYYECHITIEASLENRHLVREIVEKNKWSYSEHDEDHEIGDGLRCYANKSFKATQAVDDVIQELKITQDKIELQLENLGHVVRYKVEFVLYDVITDKLTQSGNHLISRRKAKNEQ